MKDNEMIEEAAKEIRPILENRTDICFIPNLDKPIAEEFISLGYQKINKDDIVLTEREHEIAMIHQYDVGFAFGYKKGSKETAEKCRNFVKKWAGNSEEGLGFLFDFEDFIAKQFGVEIRK